MSHYETGDWVDYVRGVAHSSKAAAMTVHLNSGCKECAETYSWLLQLVSVARSTSTVKVPDALVRRAERIFERPPAFRFDGLLSLAARLVTDTAREAQPFGIRTVGSLDHVLYQADDYTIDLRQESRKGTGYIFLVGQISPDPVVSEPRNLAFPVAVSFGKSIVASSHTNQFGEFSLDFLRRPDLKLNIAVAEISRNIEIPLTRRSRGSQYHDEEQR